MGQAKIKRQRQQEEELHRKVERLQRNAPKKRRAYLDRQVSIHRKMNGKKWTDVYTVHRDGTVYLKTGHGVRRVQDRVTLQEAQERYTALYSPGPKAQADSPSAEG